MDYKELSFEEAFEKLQATIETLEEGGLSLEASIQQFEIGMKLSNLCASMLDEAELKVSRLLAGKEGPEDGLSLVSYSVEVAE